ncbi:MAG: sensor histidine kinase [Gelidibacter sp.]
MMDAKRNFPPPNRGMRYMFPVAFSLSIFLLGGIMALVSDFYKLEHLSKQIETERKEMELQFLRSQLNPHFLFNSLNSIYSLVKAKSNDAPDALIMLSELMRYMLYEVNEKKVVLEKELNYIKNYISLQCLRLVNSENVKLQIHGQSKGYKIYPLILITFIENAFKYGTDYKGNTKISIIISIENDVLNLYVNNSIGHYKKNDVNSGVGLENINNQLEYLYKNNYKLSTLEEDGEYKVELNLKLVKDEMHNR